MDLWGCIVINISKDYKKLTIFRVWICSWKNFCWRNSTTSHAENVNFLFHTSIHICTEWRRNINWDSDSVDFNYTKPCSVSKRSCLLILIKRHTVKLHKKEHTVQYTLYVPFFQTVGCLGWLQDWSIHEKKSEKKMKQKAKMSHMRMDKVNSTFSFTSFLFYVSCAQLLQ